MTKTVLITQNVSYLSSQPQGDEIMVMLKMKAWCNHLPPSSSSSFRKIVFPCITDLPVNSIWIYLSLIWAQEKDAHAHTQNNASIPVHRIEWCLQRSLQTKEASHLCLNSPPELKKIWALILIQQRCRLSSFSAWKNYVDGNFSVPSTCTEFLNNCISQSKPLP